MEYLAHTENFKGEFHRLEDHLREVGRLAKEFSISCRSDISELSEWAGKLHDLGKYLDEFQQYLRGKRGGGAETHHAVYGAALATKMGCIPLAYSIAGHHAGLHDREDLRQLIKKPAYKAEQKLGILRSRFEAELGQIPKAIPLPEYIQQDILKLEVLTRFIFSSLVDADFLDTEAHYNAASRPKLPPLDPKQLLERLDTARRLKSASGSKLAEIRNEIYEQCRRAGDRPQGFFSLTVPTGGGKTISSMAFALEHALKHNLRRIIVVIPYLSIIEQNASEYRSILDPENKGIVIEHHSAVADPSEQEEETRITEARYRSPLVLAAENWDAPIIITTSVQFIESLFANKPSKCRKLHNIARSVVIFDEVQTLPTHLLEPLLSIWRELKQNYGVSFVFSSATQPAFKKQTNLSQGFNEGEIVEIIEDPKKYFKTLRRVTYEFPKEPLDWSVLAEELIKHQQALCIVNTRKQAFQLWDIINSRYKTDDLAIFHLSSAMCPEHRLDILGEITNPKPGTIRGRLAQKLPCIVISTQLVEAGVDLDFPIVWRALGPLDSIVQSAGRCNREGNLQQGYLKVFLPQDHKLPKGVYSTATQQAATMLHTISEEELATDPSVFQKYFDALYGLVATDYSEAAETSIQEDRKELNYKKVAKKAKVIDDFGTTVIVPYSAATELIERIRQRPRVKDQPLFTREDLRKLQRFMVNIREYELKDLERMGQLSPLIPHTNMRLYVLNEASYDKNLGVLVDRRPTDENIL